MLESVAQHSQDGVATEVTLVSWCAVVVGLGGLGPVLGPKWGPWRL